MAIKQSGGSSTPGERLDHVGRGMKIRRGTQPEFIQSCLSVATLPLGVKHLVGQSSLPKLILLCCVHSTSLCSRHLQQQALFQCFDIADPVSIASANIALLSEETKAQENNLGYHSGLDEVKRVELDVELSRQKFQFWQETWSSQGQNPDVKTPQSEATSKALWGMQGWETVQRMLDTINRASKELEAALLEFRETSKPTPRKMWKAAMHALRSKNRSRPQSKYQELKELAATLNQSIDELWLYTETVFDSLHGVMAQELRIPSRERLLASALQSRAGTLELYRLCAKTTVDWSLEMDLLGAGTMSSNSLRQEGNSSLHPCYHLFTQTRNIPTKVHRIIVENVPKGISSIEQKGEVTQPDQSELQILNSSLRLFYQLFTQKVKTPTKVHKLVANNAHESREGVFSIDQRSEIIQPDQSGLQISRPQIFKSRSGTNTVVIPVASKGCGSPSCLRIPEKSIADVHLRSSPETLASVLETLKKATSNLSISEHFSIGAKVELAYKVVECGFFLLGTPWFSSLRSKNILRLKSTGRKRHSFMLQIQTLDMDDLLFDDVEALTETSQLYRIGVLLIEIALDRPEPSIPTD